MPDPTASNDTDDRFGPIGFWRQLREDYIRHDASLTKPGLHAIWVYRFGRAILTMPRPVRLVLKLLYKPLHWHVRNVYGIELPETTQVGRRLRIGHQSGIVIHHNSIIGHDCLIRQNCTLGAGSGATADRGPTLGNNVELAAGVVIVGGIKIGDDVRVGPNAVVMMNVPPGATVVTTPPRVIPARK